MSAAFYIVTVWLLIVGVVLFVMCLTGAKKNGLSSEYEDYTEEELAVINGSQPKAKKK